eukprot:763990-Hanusia_phi.AAC.8
MADLVSSRKKLLPDESDDNTMDASRTSPKGLDASQQDWKFNALLRMKKFLRKQYRAKKNRMMDFISKPSTPSDDIESERSQLIQLATDIKSIDFEIRLLSNSKTVVQEKGRPVDELGSDDKDLNSGKSDGEDKPGNAINFGGYRRAIRTQSSS